MTADADPNEADADHRRAPTPPLDQLQAAGRELIGAVRAVLDVAEDLLDDPRTAEAVSATFASLERAATRAAATGRTAADAWVGRRAGHGGSGATDGDDDDDDDGPGPGVQRIPVS